MPAPYDVCLGDVFPSLKIKKKKKKQFIKISAFLKNKIKFVLLEATKVQQITRSMFC